MGRERARELDRIEATPEPARTDVPAPSPQLSPAAVAGLQASAGNAAV